MAAFIQLQVLAISLASVSIVAIELPATIPTCSQFDASDDQSLWIPYNNNILTLNVQSSGPQEVSFNMSVHRQTLQIGVVYGTWSPGMDLYNLEQYINDAFQPDKSIKNNQFIFEYSLTDDRSIAYWLDDRLPRCRIDPEQAKVDGVTLKLNDFQTVKVSYKYRKRDKSKSLFSLFS